MLGLIFWWKAGIFLFEDRQCQNITEKKKNHSNYETVVPLLPEI